MLRHARGQLLVVSPLVHPTQGQFGRQPVELRGVVAEQQLDHRELQLGVIGGHGGRLTERRAGAGAAPAVAPVDPAGPSIQRR